MADYGRAEALLGCYALVADDRKLHWRYEDDRKLESGVVARALCGMTVDSDAAIEGCLAPYCDACYAAGLAEGYDVDEQVENPVWLMD